MRVVQKPAADLARGGAGGGRLKDMVETQEQSP